MQLPVTIDEPWTDRRRRAEELAVHYPFAVEVLSLYAALLDVQERAYAEARRERPVPGDVAAYVSERVLPAIVDATAAGGPDELARSVHDRLAGDREELVRRWLHSEEQAHVDRYLARASAGPVLEALGVAAGAACSGPCDERHCPRCAGPPQVTYFAQSGEALVTGQRFLTCARCSASWPYPRMTCAACGESSASRLPMFSEEGTAAAESTNHVVAGAGSPMGTPSLRPPRFPHIRIEACESCHRYLLGIDLARDARAVPLVDELAAIPLDLYAQDLGMTKLTANLMGF